MLVFVGIASIKGSSTNKAVSFSTEKDLSKAAPIKHNLVNTIKPAPRTDVYHGSTDGEIAEATKNIEYSFASSSIRPGYYGNLNHLAKIIIDDNYIVSLRGHSDSIGQYKPNWMLSEKRANTVKNYLITKGVAKEHIITIPFGSTIPIATNTTAQGRQKNRRVEIKLKQVDK